QDKSCAVVGSQGNNRRNRIAFSQEIKEASAWERLQNEPLPPLPFSRLHTPDTTPQAPQFSCLSRKAAAMHAHRHPRRILSEVRFIGKRARQVWRLVSRRHKLTLGGAALVMACTS